MCGTIHHQPDMFCRCAFLMQENAEESKVDCKTAAIYINFLGIVTQTKFETRIKTSKTSSYLVRKDTNVITEVVRPGKNDLPWKNHWTYGCPSFISPSLSRSLW
jgi:hypothetical protein